MKILVTGGAGFIGSNLVRYLLEHNQTSHLRVIDDLSTGNRENLIGHDIEFVEASVLDYDRMITSARGMDSIVHLGAIPSVPRSIANPRATHYANTTGTLNVLEAARQEGVDHVVVASSSSVYGSNPNLPKNEFDWTRPMSPYAVSKAATEGYAIAYHHSYGIKTLAFRFFNVFGPGQAADHDYAAVIPKFLDAALDGCAVNVHGDGLQSRDFTYVETVCAVITEAVRRKVYSPDPVNLAYGTNTSLMELLDEMEDLLGRKIQKKHSPPRTGDVRASQADNSRVEELFPDVTPIPLSEGLAATIDWFRKQRTSLTF
jgi:UDP-glucose 4-epimerase